MKKIIAVLMVLSIVLAFAGCKSKEYKDTVVTIPVTDENGETVTDKDGNVVTEISTEAQSSSESSKTGSTQQSASKNDKNNTTKANSGGGQNNTTQKNDNSGGNNGTTKPTANSTTKPTEAPTKSKKRDIHLVVNVPTYTPLDTEMVIQYRVEGEKKFKELTKEDVKLGTAFTKEYDIKNVKGAVEFIITIDGVGITNNKFTVEASDRDQTHEITLVTGIEVMDGGMD
ncbi:MAG: hypothetical protein K2G73_01185 [Eubacterium sp.]|nr:hypothetical protein [Eubacterium sp.]